MALIYNVFTGKLDYVSIPGSSNITPPIINSITWNDDIHEDNHSYVMTIDATDPNGKELSYVVESDHSDIVTIEQNTTHTNIFIISYGDIREDTTVTYTITVTNESGYSTIETIEKTVVNTYMKDRGVFGGGDDGSYLNSIDYITISILGNANDFGDLSVSRTTLAATSNGINDRGVFGGGTNGSSYLNTIDYITISILGNANDFGDLSINRYGLGATSNGTNDRGVFGGGYNGSFLNIIDYITISILRNANDFGDLSINRRTLSATSNT